MSLPKKVKVGSDIVTISKEKNLGRMPGGYRVSGTYRKDRIKIRDGMTARDERITFIHELMHKLWEAAGLYGFLSTASEEMVLAGLDAWLYQTLIDNPALIEYLLEGGDV